MVFLWFSYGLGLPSFNLASNKKSPRDVKNQDTETYIVAGSTVDEMQSLMDDHIIKVQTMKGAPACG